MRTLSQLDLALGVLGQRGQAGLGDAGGVGGHDGQGDAGAVVAGCGGAHGHDHQLGGGEVVHEVLDAVDDQAVAVHLAAALDGVGAQARVLLLHRPGHDQVAAGDAGQDALLLLVGTVVGDGQGGGGGAVEGHRGDGAPALLQDQAEVGDGQAAAAVGLGQGDAKPAQAGHLLPELHGVAAFVLLDGAGEAGRAFRVQELPGGVLDHQLFFGG